MEDYLQDIERCVISEKKLHSKMNCANPQRRNKQIGNEKEMRAEFNSQLRENMQIVKDFPNHGTNTSREKTNIGTNHA